VIPLRPAQREFLAAFCDDLRNGILARLRPPAG
jgi:hypothetical protein